MTAPHFSGIYKMSEEYINLLNKARKRSVELGVWLSALAEEPTVPIHLRSVASQWSDTLGFLVYEIDTEFGFGKPKQEEPEVPKVDPEPVKPKRRKSRGHVKHEPKH